MKAVELIVKLFGWKADIPEDMTSRPELKRAVYVLAPHTSTWDFFIGLACTQKMGINAYIFMKKEYFNWFTSPLLHKWNVIPVDRGNTKNNLVNHAAEWFSKEENFVTILCPEGTRKAVKRWKRGFYEIAVKADVPIVCTYIDYKRKMMGVGPSIPVTGDYQNDLREIMKFYQDKTARHPERFNKQANI